eukprot:TRINITY_DN26423_c0_g1_i1.p1 TRINITY_DN26423_c0_g1~~TRINITY_DN26423_c0_g1_i1.p1  ORF type:complete len:705 (-),score=103.50 TRINITY_DN26423_c0_g1_i1:24-2138(-)
MSFANAALRSRNRFHRVSSGSGRRGNNASGITSGDDVCDLCNRVKERTAKRETLSAEAQAAAQAARSANSELEVAQRQYQAQVAACNDRASQIERLQLQLRMMEQELEERERTAAARAAAEAAIAAGQVVDGRLRGKQRRRSPHIAQPAVSAEAPDAAFDSAKEELSEISRCVGELGAALRDALGAEFSERLAECEKEVVSPAAALVLALEAVAADALVPDAPSAPSQSVSAPSNVIEEASQGRELPATVSLISTTAEERDVDGADVAEAIAALRELVLHAELVNSRAQREGAEELEEAQAGHESRRSTPASPTRRPSPWLEEMPPEADGDVIVAGRRAGEPRTRTPSPSLTTPDSQLHGDAARDEPVSAESRPSWTADPSLIVPRRTVQWRQTQAVTIPPTPDTAAARLCGPAASQVPVAPTRATPGATWTASGATAGAGASSSFAAHLALSDSPSMASEARRLTAAKPVTLATAVPRGASANVWSSSQSADVPAPAISPTADASHVLTFAASPVSSPTAVHWASPVRRSTTAMPRRSTSPMTYVVPLLGAVPCGAQSRGRTPSRSASPHSAVPLGVAPAAPMARGPQLLAAPVLPVACRGSGPTVTTRWRASSPVAGAMACPAAAARWRSPSPSEAAHVASVSRSPLPGRTAISPARAVLYSPPAVLSPHGPLTTVVTRRSLSPGSRGMSAAERIARFSVTT